MGDFIENKWQAIVMSCAALWMAWISTQIIGMNARLQAMELTHQNVIPPVVENSLRELRDKGNSEKEGIARLTEIAGRNAQDIGYLKEQLANLKGQRAKAINETP